MILWHKKRDNEKKQAILVAWMCLLSFLSFLSQGYYLAIITLFQFFMLFFYGFFYRKERVGKFAMLMSGAYVIITLSMAIVLLATTDKYLPLRRENANGYDWMEMKTRISALFSHYSFQQIYFPVTTTQVIDEPERAAYLGNVGLFAVLIFGVIMVCSKGFRHKIVQVQKEFFKDRLKAAIFIGATFMLLISFGEDYYTSRQFDESIHIINILNPLFYIHFFTKRVEQFRCLERFMWSFYFVFNIWALYTISRISDQFGKKVKVGVIVLVIFLGGVRVG